jgi:hypothetical protein
MAVTTFGLADHIRAGRRYANFILPSSVGCSDEIKLSLYSTIHSILVAYAKVNPALDVICFNSNNFLDLIRKIEPSLVTIDPETLLNFLNIYCQFTGLLLEHHEPDIRLILPSTVMVDNFNLRRYLRRPELEDRSWFRVQDSELLLDILDQRNMVAADLIYAFEAELLHHLRLSPIGKKFELSFNIIRQHHSTSTLPARLDSLTYSYVKDHFHQRDIIMDIVDEVDLRDQAFTLTLILH